MTYKPLRKRAVAVLAICTMGVAPLMIPASAVAGDAEKTPAPFSTEYQVKSSSEGLINSGVKAFRAGNYEKAVSLNKAVLRIRPSRMKTAIAQSNLCASYAKLGQIEQAAEACSAALKLRPELDVALSNQALLKTRLAQK